MDVAIKINKVSRLVNVLSLSSLLIEMRFGDTILSKGTGFLLLKGRNPYLITNRHNVTGLNQETHKPISRTAGIPDRLLIHHQKSYFPGQTQPTIEPLFDTNGRPLWLEHPSLGRKADVVALRLSNLNNINAYVYSTGQPIIDLSISVTTAISVIGFPFGLTGGGPLALWATGFVASEPKIDLDDMPVFLVDCRTRQGQSGSPVVAYRPAGEMIVTADGTSSIIDTTIARLLGVYSGRINSESDLGRVWKTSAILEVLNLGYQAFTPH